MNEEAVLARARSALSTAHHDIERFLTKLQEDSTAAAQMRADLEALCDQLPAKARAAETPPGCREGLSAARIRSRRPPIETKVFSRIL